MVFKGESITIDHGTPKKVQVPDIEAELAALSGEAVGADVRRTFGRMLTLVVYSEVDEPPEKLHELVGEIIVRTSARAILIQRVAGENQAGLEADVSTHCVMRGEEEAQQCAELVLLHAHEDVAEDLRSTVLSLRLRDLPLVVWWRARPNMEDALFSELIGASDQIILDSARFDAPADQLAKLVSRLRRESARVPFGDINWARLIPWRELIAQFFDNPEHLDYLNRLNEMSLEYSARDRGNPAQAILLVMWLATLLKWDVVEGSWERKGRTRSLRLSCEGREIRVDIHGSTDVDAPPGWLSAVALRVTGEPTAEFQINWCGDNCVTTLVKLGDRTTERSSALFIPDEVMLVSEEFDASRRDRVYHQALHVLEQLVR